MSLCIWIIVYYTFTNLFLLICRWFQNACLMCDEMMVKKSVTNFILGVKWRTKQGPGIQIYVVYCILGFSQNGEMTHPTCHLSSLWNGGNTKISQIKLLIENKLIIYALGYLHYKISREKFEPEQGFESRTSGLLVRRSTTWAILVLMPARVHYAWLQWHPSQE